jgi:nucleoid DNA-binding protein
MNIEAVINWILKNPTRYPGRHLTPQPRTSSVYKPLEPASQMLIIWKSTIEYLNEQILGGKGVNIRGFGSFCFDVETELPRPSSLNPARGQIYEQRLERKHVHRNRLCFVPDRQLQAVLMRWPGKRELERPKSQHSVYQQGFSMVYCNPVPIASASYLDKNIVVDTHNALWRAIADLTQQGRTVHVQFNFAVLTFSNLDLSVRFNGSLASSVNSKDYEMKMRRSDAASADHWRTSYRQKWNSSILSSLWQKPDLGQVRTINEKTLALKIMSHDMASNIRPFTTERS